MFTTAQLSENSHQGFEAAKRMLCLQSMQAKSNTASGMPVCLRQNGIGSRSSSKERDAETGLDYFEARYYSGAQGRFLSSDPIIINSNRMQDPQRLNAYSYVRNNPLRFIDPVGEDLYLYGAISQVKSDLCQMIGDACKNGGSNLVYDEKNHTVTVDLSNVALEQNDGAKVLSQMVNDKEHNFAYTLGTSFQTAAGKRDIGSGLTRSLPVFSDQKNYDNNLPPAGFSSSIAIHSGMQMVHSRACTGDCLSMDPAPMWGIMYHEFVESWGKVHGIPTYHVGHDIYAKAREERLRAQRGELNRYLPFSGEKQDAHEKRR
jgi:RHS repeat-associated protein